MSKKILLFAKDKPGLPEGIEYLKLYSDDITIFKGDRKNEFPKEAYGMCADLTISYLSPWIIPEEILYETKQWSINYHPGPPEYPGIGCTNFAIYNGEKEFGVTAHLMKPKVDSGKIIGVKRFPLLQEDSVYTLTEKCYDHILELFYETIGCIMQMGQLPQCEEQWQRKPYTRRQLNDLCKIEQDMDESEIQRRVKATHYPDMPGAYIELAGNKFVCQSSQ